MTDYEGVFGDAVEFFWNKRSSGATGLNAEFAGRRSEVVGGKHLDGFLVTISDILVSEGVPNKAIYLSSVRSNISGFFRSSKNWDLIVVHENQLLAAIEIKAQVGPSFGNNVNNRAEEAIGNAVDLWTAYREELFLKGPPPFVGYIFVLEECERSTTPVRVQEPHFPVDPVFKGASYAARYEVLCRRLVAERHYSATTLLITRPQESTNRPNYRVAAPEIGVQRFIELMLRTVTPLKSQSQQNLW